MDETIVAECIRENKDKLTKFLNDNYHEYNDVNEDYIYLLLCSSRRHGILKGNLFAKVLKNNELKTIKERNLSHLILIKVHVGGLYNLLILRMDIRKVLIEFKNKLMMIGSFVLNTENETIFDSTNVNCITADYSPTSRNNCYIRWFKFNFFSSFSLNMCEQVFTTCILNRDNENPWCLVHLKSTNNFKVPSNYYVSLYGIQFNEFTPSESHKFRKIITFQVGNLCTNGDISDNNNIFSTVFL